MKKLILALATVTFIGLGGSAASAALPSQLPPGCSEPSNVPTDPCYDAKLYPIEIKPPSGGEAEVAPPSPTTTVAAAADPGSLPQTGSGFSPILGVGALLLVGGGIVVVMSRRRSASAAAS